MRTAHGLSAMAVAAMVLAVIAVPGCGGLGPNASEKPEKKSMTTQAKNVLHSKFAGSWYSGDREVLAKQLKGFLGDADVTVKEPVMALIMPHAGYRYSGATAAYAAKLVAGKSFSRVVAIGPSHRVPMNDMASVPEVTHYGTPLGEVPLDLEFIAALRKHDLFKSIPKAHASEHSVQMEVPILQQALGEFRLVPIVLGKLSRETTRRMAAILKGLIDQKTLVVISSDFTHFGANFGYYPFRDDVEANLKKLDMGAFEAIKKGTDAFDAYIKKTRATVCGCEAIKLLLDMLPENAQIKLLKYDTSGRMTKDFSSSVSYLSIAVTGQWSKGKAVVPQKQSSEGFSDEEKTELLKLARKTITHYLDKTEIPSAEQMGLEATPNMRRNMGVFVSLKKKGRLRGCIGQIFGNGPLYKSIIRQAVNSATRDSRFAQLQEDELKDVLIEISALTEPKQVGSYKDIVIGKHGMVLRKGRNSAVFLPQVAPEQGWDLATTLTHLSRKAGLPQDGWKEGATYLVFEAHVFRETKK